LVCPSDNSKFYGKGVSAVQPVMVSFNKNQKVKPWAAVISCKRKHFIYRTLPSECMLYTAENSFRSEEKILLADRFNGKKPRTATLSLALKQMSSK